MKATELRIGNWVKRDCQPKGFQIDSHSFVVCERDPKMYRPIRLTKKWLKDFGFKIFKPKTIKGWIINENEFWPFILGAHKQILLEIDGFTKTIDITPPVQYVHQLQNLFFALTNNELTKG